MSLALLLVIIGNLVGASRLTDDILGIEFAPIQNLYETYSSDSRFFAAGVSDKVSYSSQHVSIRVLNIQVWYKGRPSSEQQGEIMNGVVQVALTSYENIDEIDAISITISSKYDIGIATGHIKHHETQTVEVWRQRLGRP